MKKSIFIGMIASALGVLSCSDPAQNAAKQSAIEGNNTDTSFAKEEFNRDTTIDMNSGGGTGTNQSKADTLINKSVAH